MEIVGEVPKILQHSPYFLNLWEFLLNHHRNIDRVYYPKSPKDRRVQYRLVTTIAPRPYCSYGRPEGSSESRGELSPGGIPPCRKISKSNLVTNFWSWTLIKPVLVCTILCTSVIESYNFKNFVYRIFIVYQF